MLDGLGGHAIMEEFFPGKGENLHDYLIPSAGDMPPVESILLKIRRPLVPLEPKEWASKP